MFKKGDRVRLTKAGAAYLRTFDGNRREGEDAVIIVWEGEQYAKLRFSDGKRWAVGWVEGMSPMIVHIDDAREGEEESTDDTSARKFKVGDVVEIIGEEREMIVRYYPDTSLPIIGRVEAVNVYYAVSLTNHELETISVEECDLQLAHPSDVVTSAKPRRASSRSKKIDKTAINVVTIDQSDLARALKGDDFAARPSQAFKDVMCELLIGHYEKYEKDAS